MHTPRTPSVVTYRRVILFLIVWKLQGFTRINTIVVVEYRVIDSVRTQDSGAQEYIY